jgi:hypothetical protein
VTPWTRTAHRPTRRRARLSFVALLDGARIDAALDRARDELGDARAWDALDVQVRARATDGGRLDAALDGRPRMTLASRPEHERSDVDRAQRYATIEADLADPPILTVLCGALAILRALADEGDLVLACDLATARWWAPDELAALAPDRPFELDEHVQVVVEAVERRPGVGHLVRSRGLGKFARPDVGGRGPRRDAERLSEVLRDVARVLADGAALEPGARVELRALGPCTFVPRPDDALGDAPADEAPLYELRDLGPDGPGPDCAGLLAALRPRPRLKLVR